MKSHALALFVLLLAVVGLPAQAEEITNEQILKTFESYMEAMGEGEFEALAQYIHPGELDEFKKLFITIGESAQKQDNFEGFADFLGVQTLDELKDMPSSKLFAKLFEVLTTLMPEFQQILKSAEVTLLGQVTEGQGEDEMIHLVYRMEMVVNGAKVKSVDTAAIKKAADDKYYFMMGEEVQGLVNALKNQFGGVN